MLITRVDVYNFRSIEHVSFVPRKLQLFVGENSAGKSNVIQALDLFFNGADHVDETVYLRTTTKRRATYCTIQVRFTEVPSNVADRVKTIVGKSPKHVQLVVRYERGERGVAVSGVAAEDTEEAVWIAKQILGQYIFVRIPPIRDAERDSGVDRDSVLRRLLEATFPRQVGPGRRRTVTQLLSQAVDQVQVELNKVSKGIHQIAKDLIDVDGISFIPNPPPISRLIGDLQVQVSDPVSTPLSLKGTGFQSVFLIAATKYLSEKSRRDRTQNLVLAVEEPEAFLHPNAQRVILGYLRSIAEAGLVLVSTHSTVMLDALHWRDFGNIARVVRGDDPAAGNPTNVVQPRLTDHEKQLLASRSDLRGSEILYSRGVLLVEATADRRVFERLAALQEAEFCVNGITPLEVFGGSFEPAVMLCEKFGLKWAAICDFDKLMNVAPLLSILVKRTQISSTRAAKVATVASKAVGTAADARERWTRVRSSVEPLGIFPLISDLECSLVTRKSLPQVVRVLCDEDVLGVARSTAADWDSRVASGDPTLTEEIRRFLGSRGQLCTGATKHAAGKKAHVPPRIAEQLDLDSFGDDISGAVKRASSFLLS